MWFLRLYIYFIGKILSPKFLPLYIIAIGATFLLVQSGLDWQYFIYAAAAPREILFIADGIGFLIAIFAPLILLFLAWYKRSTTLNIYAQATTYAVIIGFTVSTFIKMFTGRTSPPYHHGRGEQILIDNSHDFHFGFMREQIIGGWPSSHSTIIFALAATLFCLLPRRLYITSLLFGTALFVAMGETIGWHWLSECIAGTCLGVAIGLVVGTHFKPKLT